jgi:hypothetical protein
MPDLLLAFVRPYRHNFEYYVLGLREWVHETSDGTRKNRYE